MKDVFTDHSWQETPANLIAYGSEHAEREDEFSKQIALLLLDVGVEIMFKVYLLLDDELTDVVIDYEERKKAAGGNFYKVVEGVKKAIPFDIDQEVFSKILYFHGIRNKVYHQGDGVIPAETSIKDYAGIAELLLEILLGVDLDPEVPIDDHFKMVNEKVILLKNRSNLNEDFNNLLYDLSAATAIIRPELVMRSNINQIKELKHTYPDRDHGDLQKRALLEKKRINGLSDLTGIPFSDSYLVKQILKDIHLLYLVVVLDYTDKDRYENLKLYQEASYFSQKEHTDIMNMDPHEYQEWKEKHEDKLNRTIGKFNDWIQEMQITIEDLILKQVY